MAALPHTLRQGVQPRSAANADVQGQPGGKQEDIVEVATPHADPEGHYRPKGTWILVAQVSPTVFLTTALNQLAHWADYPCPP